MALVADAMGCDCKDWASECIVAGHHIACDKFDPKPFVRTIRELLDAMDDWASDEDGIHPAAWKAYKAASELVVRPLVSDES